MFDTVAFNRVLDGDIRLHLPVGRITVFATHVQRDEINNTRDSQRRVALSRTFENIIDENRLVPTESAVWGVSKWGQAKWTAADDLYLSVKSKLDSLNNAKKNNIQDALIGETSIKGGYVLVTDDGDLTKVATELGGRCLSVCDFLKKCDLLS